MDKKEEAINEIKKQSRTAIHAYLKKLPNVNLFTYYKELVTKKDIFGKYAETMLTTEEIDYFIHYETNLHQEKTYEQEDLAALLYLQYKLYGIDKDLRVKNVVIDEAQDYSYFQLYALKSALETDMFTIVGDLAQGIHSYRGINDWDLVVNQIFPRASYRTLQKSYRTTVEIMNTANGIMKLLNLELPTVEPVVRHGRKPEFHPHSSTEKETAKKISNHIKNLHKDGMKTVAVIGKNDKECKRISKLLKKHSDLPVQLLRENEEINKEEVVIVNSLLSKGLEFDAVLICSFDEVFEENEIDIKLLYVSMTRPLHHLSFFGKEPGVFMLDRISSELFNVN
ncbi:3'-5' exonuclease [Pseudalkalibacillus caeni]|uniref:3'-5' exonuclease n=1 Tax=Exobacillus caeni TaxID=2574798 RepID=UPI001FEC5018|nr:3'-5' exonuclease [Pseudalkalibacillus caeni]